MLGSIRRFVRTRYGADKEYYRIILDIFGILPNNIELYKLALVHRSASVFLEDGSSVNNERLEFLGDAVFESIISEYLFLSFPAMDEGEMTRLRSRIVSRSTMNSLSIDIGLSDYIISNQSSGIVQKHIYGNTLEAMIGAMYLDKGYDTTNNAMISILSEHLDMENMSVTETDFKSRLIEWCQKSKHTITFKTDFEEGSVPQRPVFRSAAIIDNMEVGYGIGASKKEAEQQAAYSVSMALTDKAGDNILDLIDRIYKR